MTNLKCFKCRFEIYKETETYCSVLTHNKGKLVEEVHFHIKCWKDYFNNCVNEKLNSVKKQVLNKFDSPLFKSVLGVSLKEVIGGIEKR
jgi:hypothetical protein